MPGPTRSFLKKAFRFAVPLLCLAVLTVWLILSPPGLLGKADGVGYSVCHRIDERSFHLDGRQLPLCARCSGMYLGAVLGLAYQALTGRRRTGTPPWQVLVPLALLAAAWAVDGTNSYLYLVKEMAPGSLAGIPNLYIPSNTLRLLTGTGMGLALAALVFPAFNQTLWRMVDPRPALPGLRSLGLLMALAAALDLAVLSEHPVVLYPLALITALGVLLLLTLVYGMLWIVIMRTDNKFDKIGQAWLPLLAGLTMALIQVALIDLGRYWLTGTWGAFPTG